jgi:DNA-directed RNA polymerase subunit M/transcription elongation factor TFIIS
MKRIPNLQDLFVQVDESSEIENRKKNKNVKKQKNPSLMHDTIFYDVPYPWVKLPIRLKGQYMLQYSLGIYGIYPMLCNDPVIRYARQLEEAIYAQCLNKIKHYKLKCCQLVYNLYENGGFLRENYSPEQLVALDDYHLAEDTMREREQQEFNERVQTCRDLMNTTKIFSDDLSYLKPTMKCNKCKSSDISKTEGQTRSADEGATVYCLCNNCGKRWTIKS